jgi:hypothetical protein
MCRSIFDYRIELIRNRQKLINWLNAIALHVKLKWLPFCALFYRHCYGLAHTTQSDTKCERAVRRAAKISEKSRKRLGAESKLLRHSAKAEWYVAEHLQATL